MVTDRGNTDPIPTDIVGRLIWVAKHFGAITAFCVVLLWQGKGFVEEQNAERKEQGKFLRETLTTTNERSVEAITKAAMAIERQARESERVGELLDRNADVLDRVNRALEDKEK